MEVKDILIRKNMVKCWKILEFEIYYLVLRIEANVYLVIKFAKKKYFSLTLRRFRSKGKLFPQERAL